MSMPRLSITYKSVAEILSNATFSEEAARKYLDSLPDAVRAQAVTGWLIGSRPCMVSWPDGAFAITLLPPDGSLPPPEEVVEAYLRCRLSGHMTALEG